MLDRRRQRYEVGLGTPCEVLTRVAGKSFVVAGRQQGFDTTIVLPAQGRLGASRQDGSVPLDAHANKGIEQVIAADTIDR